MSFDILSHTDSLPQQDPDKFDQEKKSSKFQEPEMDNESGLVNDSVCRICGGGGELLNCATCPAAFHLSCLQMDSEPEEKWVCGPCACQVCRKPDFTREGFDDNTILLCDHCNAQYHVGCHRHRFNSEITELPSGNWFCSPSCQSVFTKLNKLLGKPRSVSLERGKTLYTFQVLHGNGCLDAIIGNLSSI